MRTARLLAAATLPLLIFGCAARQNDPLAHATNSPHAASHESTSNTETVAHAQRDAFDGDTDLGGQPINLLWFGPTGESAADNAAWQGALLATQQANRAGGLDGRPFKLVPITTDQPDNATLQQLTRLVLARDIWGFVGVPDRATAPLLTQAATQAKLPYINAATHHEHPLTDDTAQQFVCTPPEQHLAQTLAQEIAGRTIAGGRIALVTGTGLDARFFTNVLRRQLQQYSLFPETEVYIHPHASTFTGQIRRIQLARPAAVVVVAEPEQTASFVKALYAENVSATVFGGPAMGSRAFLTAAGERADGVFFPLLWHTSQSDRARTFTQDFINTYQQIPDYRAAHAFDATKLLIDGIKTAGFDRAAVRNAVRRQSPYHGVSGTITWGPTGQNERRPILGTITKGRIQPVK